MEISLDDFKKVFKKKFNINNYKKVYIIGSGPSIKNINLKELNQPENFIIGINYAFLYDIKIDMLFSTDSSFFRKIHTRTNNYLNIKNIFTVLYQNITNKNDFISSDNLNLLNIYHINTPDNQHFNNLDEFISRVPLNILSGNRGIFMSVFLGFKNIFVIGFDSIKLNIKQKSDYKNIDTHGDNYHRSSKNSRELYDKSISSKNNINDFLNLIKNDKNNKLNIIFL